MKVLSYADVITNSSTETFIVFTKKGIDNVKSILDHLLFYTSGNHFDDLFEIKVDYDDDYLGEVIENWDNLSEEEKLDTAFEFDENREYDSTPVVYGFYVEAKDPINDHLAKELSSLYNIFEVDYCDS